MLRPPTLRWRHTLAVPILLGAALSGALSCGDSSTAPAPARVARVQFTETADSVEIGSTRLLSVQLLDAQGVALSGRTVTWQSSDTSVATVDNAGTVTGRRIGVTTVTALADTASGTVGLVVRPLQVTHVTLPAAAYTLTEGDTLTLKAPQLVDRTGAAVTDRQVTYALSSGTAVQVTPGGFVTATTAGSAVVTARIDTIATPIAFTVNPAVVASVRVIPSLADVAVGHLLHTQATAYAPGGAQLTGHQYTYTSANSGVATVNTSGVITGIAPGATTVTVATGSGSMIVPVSVASLGGGTFHVDVRFLGTVSTTLRTAALAAAARWEQVITQPLVPYQVVAAAGDCGKGIPAVNETVQNMIIYVQADSIDGRGKIAGQASPCIIRDDAPQLTALGTLEVDTADVASTASAGVLTDLLTHEMGHIIGIGTLWDDNIYSPLPGPHVATGIPSTGCGADPEYVGLTTRIASAALGFTQDSTLGVPIENTGGSGTCNSHWRGTVFGHELMTGTLHNGSNPMSLVTIEALGDLGYSVTPQAAADFSILNATNPAAFPSPSLSIGIPINEHVTGPRFTVTRSGQLNPIRARIVPAP